MKCVVSIGGEKINERPGLPQSPYIHFSYEYLISADSPYDLEKEREGPYVAVATACTALTYGLFFSSSKIKLIFVDLLTT